MTPEELKNEIGKYCLFIGLPYNKSNLWAGEQVIKLIQQAKEEWETKIADKIIEFDKGELSRYELVSFAYEIINASK